MKNEDSGSRTGMVRSDEQMKSPLRKRLPRELKGRVGKIPGCIPSDGSYVSDLYPASL